MAVAHDVAATIGRYVKESQGCSYQLVGNGPYAIVNEFDDGGRSLGFVGFASASDAELFAAYMRARLAIETPATAADDGAGSMPRIAVVNGMLSMIPPAPAEQRRIVDFRVVALIYAVPTTALAVLEGGVFRVTRRDRPRLSTAQYAAALSLLADRGYLRGHARSRGSTPFDDLDPFIVMLDFGLGIARPYIEPDDHFAFPLAKVA